MPSNLPIRLIAGLGNPGSQYDQTRHNAGFWFVDAVARQHGKVCSPEKRFSGDVCKLSIANDSLCLLKPMQFMNRSGLAVRQLADFYRIPVQQILVVHDDLDLPAGAVRLKQGGGHGGHNGLRDLHTHLGSGDYWRLRLGIGHPGDRTQVVGYVLSRPAAGEEAAIHQAIDSAVAQMDLIHAGEMQKAMQALHTR